MTPGSIARRYARALYDLALADGNVGETGRSVAEVAAAVAASESDLAPGALATGLRRKLGMSLAAPFGADSTFGKFIQLLALRDRLTEMPGIAHWFERFEDEAAGRVRLKVRTAEALTADASESVAGTFSRLAGKEILTEATIEPDLIGGAVVELEGRVFDGSVKTKLARMTARMAGNA